MNKEQLKEFENILCEYFEARSYKEHGESVKKAINFISKIKADQRQDIKKDLLKIAKRGEMEELRREVERYFEKL